MLVDTHTHLDSFVRKGALPEVLARARDSGVGKIITIGTDADDWELYRELSGKHAGVVHYTVGLHPCSVGADWAERARKIEGFWGAGGTRPLDAFVAGNARPEAARHLPVAIGETGLDRFHLPKDDAAAGEKIFAWQREAFAEQMRIATRLGCPLVVHSRGAFRDCVEMIDAAGFDWSKVVFHCFSEGPDEMRELMRRGGYGSFTGIITYKSAEAVRAAALAQGLDRLMLETDAPFLTPMPHRGKPNEVSYIRHTAEFCAELFGVSLEKLAEVTSATARSFFAI